MAVGFGVKGLGALDGEELDTHVGAAFDLVTNPGDCIIAPIAFSAADLALGPFKIVDLDLGDLSRKVMYGDIELTSLGIIPWGTVPVQAWTEVFALLDSPGGKQRIYGAVGGGGPSKRFVRVGAATYTGVDSVGPLVTAAGTGTAMTISETASAADRLVGVYGTRSGMSAFTGGSLRYLDNTGIGLMIADAAGTGSPQNLTATRQKAGDWGGIVVPLYAADTVASCPPIPFDVGFGPAIAHREPRLGGLRRQVFEVPLDSYTEVVDTADPKTPDDVTPLTLNWKTFLDKTFDRIKDARIDAGGLDIVDSWFTDIDTTVMLGGGSAGGDSYTIKYHIDTWGGESYTRSLRMPVKNL